ncbi:hypothetical protein [Chitinophaga tropicalis]|uniref:Uncharacterized protein n=1 Tax=Chitinophaga tropicalis TaxID=2683588 RepID=A0A7K1U3X9_9BACT|nr:hypothetical protein [Chitinophaga tropicalis]MVT09061.1 hypothetical protein [Chitinophaga tropicalis]
MKRRENMSSRFSKILSKMEKPVVGKLSFSEEDLRRSSFLNKKIEQAKRSLKEHPVPIELLKSR